MRVQAIVLAAGEGRRVGGPKALLRLGEESFAGACVRALRAGGADGVIVVAGCRADEVAALLPVDVSVVRNERWPSGMLSSALLGIDAAERAGADAVLLHPVDHPLLEPATVAGVIAALRGGAAIAVPSHAGRRGHPGGFARETWPAIRAAPEESGVRSVLRDHPWWIVHVPAGPDALAGIDTPEDLERLTKRTG
jgi:nicotine blue oxidoreductase